MSAASARSATPERSVEDRLEALRRYSTLVVHQARALEDDDLDRFQALADEREELQEALDEDGPVELTGHDSPGVQHLLDRTRTALQAAAEADAAILARLGRTRRETATDLRAMEAREPQVRRYLHEEESGSGAGRSRINIRL